MTSNNFCKLDKFNSINIKSGIQWRDFAFINPKYMNFVPVSVLFSPNFVFNYFQLKKLTALIKF